MIIGNTITFTSPLEDIYLKSNSAGIQKITPIKDATVKGIRFINTVQYKNQHGVYFDYGVNVRVTECYFDMIEYTAIRLYSCIDSRVDHNSVWRSWKDGQGYGTSIAWACQNVVVEYNDYHQCRHSTMVGGGGTRPGICRHITFQNNFSEDSVYLRSGVFYESHQYDCHNTGEDISFISNEATGKGTGFNCEFYSGILQNNYAHDLTLYGILVANPSTYTGPITIKSIVMRNVEVSGNTISRSKSDGILVYASNCNVHNNTITQSARYGIFLHKVSDSNTIHDNIITLSGWANIYNEGTNNNIS
jgi:parallel beta-helix repeat protein